MWWKHRAWQGIVWGGMLARLVAATEPAPFANAGDTQTAAGQAAPQHGHGPHDLQVRYAAGRLRVAELDLARALAANEAVRDAIGDREVQRLRNHVSMLRRQVDIAREHPRTAARQTAIAAAEAACTDARADLEAAERANDRAPGTVSGINIERLRAKVDVADIRLELCRSPDYELSLIAELEWNVEQLTAEVIDLRHRLETSGKHDAGQPR
jgi:hypothetical protein